MAFLNCRLFSCFISLLINHLCPQSPLRTLYIVHSRYPFPSVFCAFNCSMIPVPVSSALQFFQTLNTYSHLSPNKQAEVAQQLENLINGTVPDSSQLTDVANKPRKKSLESLIKVFQRCSNYSYSMDLF